MTLVIKTETGSVYSIRNGIYMKNGGNPRKIWTLKSLDADFQPINFDDLHNELEKTPNVDRPEVGKRMYISGREGWNYSTVVVSVEEYHDLPTFLDEC